MSSSSALILNITDLSSNGLGVGRSGDGLVVMVHNALPGETVRARLTEQHKSYAVAVCLEVITTSPQRVEAPCPYFSLCGGCQLQHLDYEAQIRAKAAWLLKALRAFEPLPPLRIIPSQPFAYRHRLRLHRGIDGGLGFYVRSSRALLPVDNCLLAVDSARRSWEELSVFDVPGIWELELLAGKEKEELAVKIFGKNSLPPFSLNQPWRVSRPGEDPDLEQGIVCYQRDGLTMRAWPGVFSQVNWEVNEHLISHLRSILSSDWDKGPVVDLFAGSGNLSLPLAHAGAEVWAVEGDRHACRIGRRLALTNRLQCRFVNQPVSRFLQKNKIKGQTVIADPPRSGMKDLTAVILRQKPRLLVYISCHISALARDAQTAAAAGYVLTDLLLLDMFAQTSQAECLAVFRM
ncbi:MAG: TRAM domain-containing protein [Desulfarculales bacterium]|nr:TRAM domain-containing protein [Desulfarculales bacterium]